MNYKLKNQLFFYLTLLIAFLLVVTNRNNGFFWDTIQLASQHGNYYYSNNFSNLLLPIELDSGHIPTFGMYIALIWKAFGRTVEASHLSMLPFAIGIVWQLNNLCKQFIVEKYSGIALLLIFVDASLMSQITLVSPDVPLMFFFLLTLNAVFKNKKELIVIGVLGLFLTSMRGMMLSLCLMIIDIYVNYSFKNLMSFDNIKKLLKRSLLYLPALTLFICFSIYHFHEKGWIGYHKDSPWADCFERTDINGFLFNIGLLGWRLIDFGRIGVWIVCLIIFLKFKKNILNDKQQQVLLLSFIIILILLPLNMLWAKNLMGHRYLLPIYITFSLLTAAFTFSSYVPDKIKNSLIVVWLLIGLSGNFWIYPAKISKGWDSTLAHLPYHQLRTQALNYIDSQKINYKDVTTFFPNYYSLDDIDLNNDKRFFNNYTIGNNSKYILYSNIFNVDDAVYDDMMKKYKPVKEFKNSGVFIVLMEKSN